MIDAVEPTSGPADDGMELPDVRGELAHERRLADRLLELWRAGRAWLHPETDEPATGDGHPGRRQTMEHYVVMEAKIGSKLVWAWGLVRSGPGFDEVYYTEPDGFTPAELNEAPRLGHHLFTVQVVADSSVQRWS